MPAEMKEGLDVRRTVNFLGREMVFPFRPGFLPPEFTQEIPFLYVPKAMRGGGPEEIPGSCPFCEKGRCRIYELRPALCRFYGTTVKPPFACKRGHLPERPLDDGQILALMTDWFLE